MMTPSFINLKKIAFIILITGMFHMLIACDNDTQVNGDEVSPVGSAGEVAGETVEEIGGEAAGDQAGDQAGDIAEDIPTFECGD